MSLTPVEIRHLQLGRSLRGYSTSTVDRLLAEIADAFENRRGGRGWGGSPPGAALRPRRSPRRVFARSSGSRQISCRGESPDDQAPSPRLARRAAAVRRRAARRGGGGGGRRGA